MQNYRTNCNCPLANENFYCERHDLTKSPHFQKLCRERPEYFSAWEKGIGPGQLKKQKTRRRVVLQPIPKSDWPKWVRLISRFKQETDRGIGDTFEHVANKFGGFRIKLLSKKLGIPCGCGGRKVRWNTLYPYDPQK